MPDPDLNETASIIVDALTLAKQGGGYENQFRHRTFSRLDGLVVSNKPVLDVSLQFDLKRGVPAIKGTLQGSVELVCQRCMKSMQYSLNELFDLLVVDKATASSNEKQDDKSDDLDDVLMSSEMDEWIADATHLDVVALVEEQLLLSLPLVAKHEDESQCIKIPDTLSHAQSNVASQDKRAELNSGVGEDLARRPFANLRELLSK
ncbi:MAG TPA: DUF177 domain-containing protein [Steroidobacteraceae bacterium]|nr:DUF177 domain-containing protein [Steroidobacteraceae bacterium]